MSVETADVVIVGGVLAWASFPVFRDWAELMDGPPVFTRTGFVNVVGPEYTEALGRKVEMLRGIGYR